MKILFFVVRLGCKPRKHFDSLDDVHRTVMLVKFLACKNPSHYNISFQLSKSSFTTAELQHTVRSSVVYSAKYSPANITRSAVQVRHILQGTGHVSIFHLRYGHIILAHSPAIFNFC